MGDNDRFSPRPDWPLDFPPPDGGALESPPPPLSRLLGHVATRGKLCAAVFWQSGKKKRREGGLSRAPIRAKVKGDTGHKSHLPLYAYHEQEVTQHLNNLHMVCMREIAVFAFRYDLELCSE